MPPILEKLLSMPHAAKLLFALNVGSLLFALIMQYGFDVLPCILCLWQRVPYVFVAGIALLMGMWKPYGRQTFVLICLAIAAYLIGAGIAVFHTGVEQHWWAGTSSCSIAPIQGASPEDLRKALLEKALPSCDKPSWDLFGITLTNMNILMSLGMAFLSGLIAAKHAQEHDV